MERLPTGIVSPKGKELEDFLNSRVKGQQRAVRYLREYLEIYWAGLRDLKRPIANFLFIGPSGVGKTELAKALAAFLFGKPDRLTIINCSEFAEGFEVSALKGAPPAYKGHGDTPPLLTQWNIDCHHVEHLCEIGEFLDELTLNSREYLAKLAKLEDAILATMISINSKISKHEEKIDKLEKSLRLIDNHAKLKLKEEDEKNNQRIRAKIEEDIKKARRDIAGLKESLENQRKNLDRAFYSRESANGDIERYKKLKNGSPEERLEEFRKLMARGGYDHKAGRYKSIVLWDEIEKAGGQVHDVLLPIMDEGRITLLDPPGQEVVFNNTINIFTSNLGSDDIAKELSVLSRDGTNARIGFTSSERDLSDEELEKLDNRIVDMTRTELRRFFRPEFVNRISKVIVFRPLDAKALTQILDLRIQEINCGQTIKLEVDSMVREFLVRQSLKYWSEGARLLASRIHQFISVDIAPLINSGLLKPGDTVVVKLGKDKKLEFYKKPPPATA